MSSKTIHRPTWTDSPGVWFSILCNAIAEHGFARAADAQQNLRRLGVTGQFRDLQTVRDKASNWEPEARE